MLLPGDLITHISRYRDTADGCECLNASCHIDAVTIDIISMEEYPTTSADKITVNLRCMDYPLAISAKNTNLPLTAAAT